MTVPELREAMKMRHRKVLRGRLLVGVSAALSSCVRTPGKTAMKQVARPRAGRAIGGRVAVVYSREYQINLGGFERLHSFDIHKYAKIYRALVAAGTIRPGHLEQSNVEIAREFVNLITASTGIASASRVVRVADDLLQELLLLAR